MIERYTRPGHGEDLERGREVRRRGSGWSWRCARPTRAAAASPPTPWPASGHARVDIARILEIQRRVKHEMIALLTSLEEQLGADSRFVHIGLTTNDVWDTATALQLRDAADLLIAGQERLRGGAARRWPCATATR